MNHHVAAVRDTDQVAGSAIGFVFNPAVADDGLSGSRLDVVPDLCVTKGAAFDLSQSKSGTRVDVMATGVDAGAVADESTFGDAQHAVRATAGKNPIFVVEKAAGKALR